MTEFEIAIKKEKIWIWCYFASIFIGLFILLIALPLYLFIGEWGRKKVRKYLNKMGVYEIIFGIPNKYSERIELENKEEKQ